VFQGGAAVLRRRNGRRDQRGATLVEFAFVLPVFILFLFAIIDFGWLFTQFLGVKQSAREGARLAIVNDCGGLTGFACTDAIVQKVCARSDGLKGATVALRRVGSDAAEVSVSRDAVSLTGMMALFIDGKTLNSTVQMRREQNLRWTDTPTSPPTCP
jgi:Flp pilus assembly protein TadG